MKSSQCLRSQMPWACLLNVMKTHPIELSTVNQITATGDNGEYYSCAMKTMLAYAMENHI